MAPLRPALLLAFCVVTLASGCAVGEPKKTPHLVLALAGWGDLPGWQSDNVSAVLPALNRSCAAILRLPQQTDLGIAGKPENWEALCSQARTLPAGDEAKTRLFLQSNFVAFHVTGDGAGDGLFTGYYEAGLRGSLHPDGRYRVPLYRRPPDLISVDLGRFRPSLNGERIAGRIIGTKLVPYADRRQIEAGALANKALELAWVDDPVDAFFLAVQGSGRVTLADGSMMRVGYDGENGWPYVSIGHVLVTKGISADQITMPFLRDWLAAHPGEAQALLDANPSYIFFKETTGEGPVGSEGVSLTPERSAAVDRNFISLGLPVWIDASDPSAPSGRLQRLLVAQDTGGAIRGPVRADIFFGYGAAAETHAGLMKGRGGWWILVPAETVRNGNQPQLTLKPTSLS